MHRLIQDHLEEVLLTRGSLTKIPESAKVSGTSMGGALSTTRGLSPEHPAIRHLDQCEDCRVIVETMRDHGALLQEGLGLSATAEMEREPTAGFYARVMERIEAQRPVSVWNAFFDSMWGRRLATASLAMAVLLTGYVVSSEALGESNRVNTVASESYPLLPTSDFAGEVFAATSYSGNNSAAAVPSGNAVFASLVSYRER